MSKTSTLWRGPGFSSDKWIISTSYVAFKCLSSTLIANRPKILQENLTVVIIQLKRSIACVLVILASQTPYIFKVNTKLCPVETELNVNNQKPVFELIVAPLS